jgi:dCTP deaminase
MLTRQAIDQAVKDGLIIIEPYNKSQLQPNSYDVRLGKTMFVIKSFALDFKKQYKYKEVTIPESGMWLWPWGLYLGVTEELTFSPHHVPVYEGRSTTGRYFLCSY